MKRPLFFSILALMLLCGGASRSTAEETVKVFLLAGQSNMEGKATNELITHQATDEKTRALFAHLRSGEEWKVRDDVFIKFLERSGGLTIGYGSPGRTGPELEFGHLMGENLKNRSC